MSDARSERMRVGIITREYPPAVYGGAGVHVDFLTSALRELTDPGVAVDVHCMGDPAERDGDRVYVHAETDDRLPEANAALRFLATDLEITHGLDGVDLAHSHTWYANMAGHWAKLLYGIPHVISAHSLEPLRPWKAEQLGDGGYRLSLWAEQTAYQGADAIVAVSNGMRKDILQAYPDLDPDKVEVIYNGIDAEFYHPDSSTESVEALGIDPDKPYVVFVGRITRQKGVPHLLRAARDLDPGVQLLLLAGTADTPELKAESEALIDELRADRDGVVWVSEMLPRDQVRQCLTHATVFCCPSVYEPLGIVNLEAMACETAVVASDVGGIPEVVVDGETGTLVHYDKAATAATDGHNPAFEAALAEAINALCADPQRAEQMGQAGRERAVAEFDWSAIAEQTAQLYKRLIRANG